MKFTSKISDAEKEQLKKQGSIPVKFNEKDIGKAYIDEHDKYIIEINEQDIRSLHLKFKNEEKNKKNL